MGGFCVLPDYDINTVLDDYATLILIGNLDWDKRTEELIIPLINTSINKGIIIGAICNASLFLGKHGF